MKMIFEKWWHNDTKVFQIINYKKAWKENGRLTDICDTNPNCECDPETCGFAVECSMLEDVGKGIHRYMCGRDKCKYQK